MALIVRILVAIVVLNVSISYMISRLGLLAQWTILCSGLPSKASVIDEQARIFPLPASRHRLSRSASPRRRHKAMLIGFRTNLARFGRFWPPSWSQVGTKWLQTHPTTIISRESNNSLALFIVFCRCAWRNSGWVKIDLPDLKMNLGSQKTSKSCPEWQKLTFDMEIENPEMTKYGT